METQTSPLVTVYITKISLRLLHRTSHLECAESDTVGLHPESGVKTEGVTVLAC